MSARFSLGQTMATPDALAALTESGHSPCEFLRRHISGDWGDVDAEDQQSNEDALLHGERLLSAYRTGNGTKLWVITEADRSVTTILLPSNY